MLRRYLFLFLVSSISIYTVKGDEDALQVIQSSLQYLSKDLSFLNLTDTLQSYELPGLFRRHTDVSSFKNIPLCLLCDLVLTLLFAHYSSSQSKEVLEGELIFFCTALKIEDNRVCTGAIKENMDIISYILENDRRVTGQRFCSMIMQHFNCFSFDSTNWSIDIPPRKTVKRKVPSGETFNILHITDIHVDPRYTRGKVADCNEPSCCQNDQEDAPPGTRACGYWSEYENTDSPIHLLEEVIEQSKAHKLDYVYMTGDLVSHRVWQTSIESNIELLTKVYDLFLKNYNVPVIPVLGNHESHPVNQFSEIANATSSLSTKWLYNLLSKEWSDRLSIDNALNGTITKGGFYTFSPRKGFRIIVINNNVCTVENWWLLLNDKDPYGQLKWLVEVLLKAENDEETVHLLGHIPPGAAGCYKTWSREFNRIIERFSHIVAVQFYGHTHKDEFYLHYNSSDELEAINIGFNGASVMTDRSNPSYKIYEVDAAAFNVVEMSQYTFNLTQANENPAAEPQWYRQYSFKRDYGLNSMHPMDVDALVMKMARDHSLIDRQFRYKLRDSDWAYKNGCDSECHKRLLCSLVTTDSSNTKRCQEISRIYDANV